MSGVFGQKFGRRYGDHSRSCSTSSISSQLRVLPGEVGVRLGEAGLREQRHHRRACERLGEEDRLRVARAHLRDQPLPERQRLRVRVVDAEHASRPALAPAEHDGAQRRPRGPCQSSCPSRRCGCPGSAWAGSRRTSASRRDGAGTNPGAPQPGMVGRASGSRSRARAPCRAPRSVATRRAKSSLAAERRVDRVVAALRRRRSPTGCPRSPGSPRSRVVPPLPVRASRSGGSAGGRATSKPSSASAGTTSRDPREPAPRAREELVPGAEPRQLALDVELEASLRGGVVPVPGRESRRPHAPLVDGPAPEQGLALGELAPRGLPGRLPPSGRSSSSQPACAGDPRLDLELPAPDRVDLERACEAVVPERAAAAPRASGRADARWRTTARRGSCPSRHDRRGDRDLVPDARLRRPAAAVRPAARRPRSRCRSAGMPDTR